MPAEIGSDNQIVVGLVALLGTVIATFVVAIRNSAGIKTAAEQSAQASAAVNHTQYGERRLYDLVKKIEERQDDFDRKWGNLPAEMGDAVGLVELLHGMDHRIAEIQAQLIEHVAWEMSQKYPKGES